MSIAGSDTMATGHEPTAAARAALVQHIANVMEEIREAQANVTRLQTELSVLSAELRGLDRAVELGRSGDRTAPGGPSLGAADQSLPRPK